MRKADVRGENIDATVLPGSCKIAKGASSKDIWKNSPKIKEAFKKKLLTNTANFIFPDPKAPLALMSDASLVAIEATLKQYG